MISCFVRYGSLHSAFPCSSHVTHYKTSNRDRLSKREKETIFFKESNRHKFCPFATNTKTKKHSKTHINIDLQIHR
jgi:hypothetical protein